MSDSGIVLVVGEHGGDGAAIYRAIQHYGFYLVHAESAMKGVDVVRAQRPALVFYDLLLAEQGDFDFAAALDRSGLKTIPLIGYAAHLNRDMLADGLRTGADDFINTSAKDMHIRSRLAFWMAGGFLELPAELRRRAQSAALDLPENIRFEEDFSIQETLVQSVIDKLQNELAQVGPSYGERKIERICFLGRLSKLILEESHQCSDFVRFPDYCHQIVRGLQNPYFQQMDVLFRRFEAWSCDPRFVFSGVEALRPTCEYEWYSAEYTGDML